jgi:hypothetical protein
MLCEKYRCQKKRVTLPIPYSIRLVKVISLPNSVKIMLTDRFQGPGKRSMLAGNVGIPKRKGNSKKSKTWESVGTNTVFENR